MESNPTKDEAERSLLNVVYSCWLCHATFDEVYATRDDTQGFTDRRIFNQRHVTKLYMTECFHVVCAKHFKNGAPAFYPSGTGEPALEACPYCVKTVGDDSLKKLFGVTGFEDGEYDEELPPYYFVAPPSDNHADRGAAAFQYASLVHWATATAAKLHDINKQDNLLKQCAYEFKTLKLKLQYSESEFKEQEKVFQKLQQDLEKAEGVLKDTTDKLNLHELYKNHNNDSLFALFEKLCKTCKEKDKEISELKGLLRGINDYRGHLEQTNHALEYGTWLESKLPELRTGFELLGRPFPAMTFEEWKVQNPPKSQKRPASAGSPNRRVDIDALRAQYRALSSHPPVSPPHKKVRRHGIASFEQTSHSDSALGTRPLSSQLMPPPPRPFQNNQQVLSFQGLSDPRTPKGHETAPSAFDPDEVMTDCATGSGQYGTASQQSVPGLASLPGPALGSPFGSSPLTTGLSPDRGARATMYVPAGNSPFASQGALSVAERRHSSVVSPSYMNLLNRVGEINDLNLKIRDPRSDDPISVGVDEGNKQGGMMTPNITPEQQDTPRKRFSFSRPSFRPLSSRKNTSGSQETSNANQGQAGTFTFGAVSPATPAPVTPTPRPGRRESVRRMFRKFRIN